MLQALPEHRPADALVDARQALVRRVVAATPMDVRAARNRRRREQADHRRAVAVVRRRATRGEIPRATRAEVNGRGTPVGVARQTRADVVLALCGPLARHERRRRELLGQHDAHRRRHRAELLPAHRAAAPVPFADAPLLLRRFADAAVVVHDSLHKFCLLAADAEVSAPADRLQFVYRSGGQRHRVVVGLVAVVFRFVLRRWRFALIVGFGGTRAGAGGAAGAGAGAAEGAAAAGVSIRLGSAAALAFARVLAAAGSMPFLINREK